MTCAKQLSYSYCVYTFKIYIIVNKLNKGETYILNAQDFREMRCDTVLFVN